LPARVGKRELLLAGMIAGIGFTVALFIAGEAFSDAGIREAAKMGAMLSILVAPLAFLVARLMGVRKIR
jgi:NhaA family Na+:H+ antiporter